MTAPRPALGAGWTMWPHVLVRGAGFPFALLDEVFRAAACDRALRRIAADPKFREAVTWQNRAAVVNALDPLIHRSAEPQNARARRQRLLVAQYLQRYCAKNDTIGFFGPVGWATTGGEAHFAAGPALVLARATLFEPWAVHALARTVGDTARLSAPVTLPGDQRLRGSSVMTPDAVLRLTADEARLVRAADGRRAEELLKSLAPRAAERSRWRQVLDQLVARGILRWEFPVSVSLDPDRQWRALADCADLAAVREKREAVARAAGDPVRLGAALEALESEFKTRAGMEPRREAGTHRWGRGLVFEECRRAISLDLGSAAIERVAPALRVVLRVARWYTFQIAAQLVQALRAEHRQHGRARVPLHVFWRRAGSRLDDEIVLAVGAVAERLRARWKKMWDLAARCGDQEHLDVERANAFVTRHFSAPCPGWPGARHHAPDLLWDAPDAETLLAGAGTPVLGELHPGVSPFTTLSVLSLCPVLDELRAEWEADFDEPLVSPIPWEEFARSSHDARLAKQHWHLDLGEDFASDRPARQVLRAADLDVIAADGRLVAVHRKKALRFDLLRVFERRIKLRAATGFALTDGADAGPRRYLGPLVVQRAYRRVAALPFGDTTAERHARVEAWRLGLGLPERVFVRVPEEMKPIYVDLTSAISVEMLVRLARRASSLTFSEMYPGPQGLWLRDGAGNTYTGELRCIAVDPKPFAGNKVWEAAARLAQ
jgi:hypothetical protein